VPHRTRQLWGEIELLDGVLPHRLEHLETRGPVLAVHLPQQALVGQAQQPIHGFDSRQGRSEVVHDRLDGLDVRAREAGEDGEEALLGGRQQLVAPVDRRAQGLLALGEVARAAAQRAKAAAKPLPERVQGEDAQAGGRELDREREAFQPTADLGDEGGVVIGDPEIGPDLAGALDEEEDGLEPGEVLHRRGTGQR
jgi:hypothetical protein